MCNCCSLFGSKLCNCLSKTDENNYVTQVAEKKPISDCATVGVYYWKKGSDYVKYAEQMIDKNINSLIFTFVHTMDNAFDYEGSGTTIENLRSDNGKIQT